MIRKILLAIALVAFAFLSFGCETFKGMGRDIQSAGEAVEDTSEDVQGRL